MPAGGPLELGVTTGSVVGSQPTNRAKDSSPMYFFITIFLFKPASTAGGFDQYFQLTRDACSQLWSLH